MADLAKVKRNVAKMVSMNAPEGDIDAYISSEGTTVDAVKAFGQTEADKPVGGLKAFGMGVVRGIRDPIDAGAQMLARGIEAVAPSYKGQREKTEAVNKAAEQDYQQNWLEGRGEGGAALGGRIAGNVGATLPLTMAVPGATAATLGPRIASGAGAGAIAGGLTPLDMQEGDSFATEKAKQIALGAGLGGAGSAVLNAASRVASPVLSKAAQAMKDAGVTMTPGQAIGGMAANLEEKAASIPVVGSFISRARDRSTADFNRATINKALAPIGEKIDDAVAAGHEAIVSASRKASQAYQKVLPGLTVNADDALLNDLVAINRNAALAPGNIGEKVAGAIDEHVMGRIGSAQTMTGEALKEAESELGRLARKYMTSQTASERHFAEFLTQAQSSLRSAVERSNPAKAAELRAANQAWANMTRIWEAGYRARNADGVFTPKQLMEGVVAADRYLGRKGIAQARGNMQQWAGDASKALGNTVPDSGTAGRVMAGAMVASPLGLYQIDPVAGAGLAALTLPYTRLGQRAANALLTKRPAAAAKVGGILGQSARVAAPAAAYGILNR